MDEFSVGKVIGMVVFLLAVIFTVGWVAQGNDFFMYKFFAPKYEQTRREVFENTKSYNQGMIQELQNMQFEYVKADPAHKDALASVILRRAADFDADKLPPDLRQFIEQLRRERASAR